MTIECYISECPKHSCHYDGDSGPFCDEVECIKDREALIQEVEDIIRAGFDRINRMLYFTPRELAEQIISHLYEGEDETILQEQSFSDVSAGKD